MGMIVTGEVQTRIGPPGQAILRRPRELGANLLEIPETPTEMLRAAYPYTCLDPEVRRVRTQRFPSVCKGVWRRWIAKALGLPDLYGMLHVRHLTPDGALVDYGLVCLRLMTAAFMEELVNELDDGAATAFTTYRFHGIGTSSAAEDNTDTALTAELTTEYQTDNTRATGTHIQPSANKYQTVATNQVDAGVTIEEQGVFNNATVASGTMIDRNLTGTIVLLSGAMIETTFTATFNAET